MGLSYIPTNSVEFETLTTEPTWGDSDAFDTNPFSDYDKESKKEIKREIPSHWKLLSFFNRDLRLGNLSIMYDDLEYLEDRASFVTMLLSWRNGVFSELAPLALSPVVASVELSQSRSGFFRKNARTSSIVSEHSEKGSQNNNFISKLFGKKPSGGAS